MAEDAASFSTETLSISSGFSISISPGTLSINISGEPLPLMEATPRMLNFVSPPGSVPPEIESPGTAPCNADATEVTGRSPRASSIFT